MTRIIVVIGCHSCVASQPKDSGRFSKVADGEPMVVCPYGFDDQKDCNQPRIVKYLYLTSKFLEKIMASVSMRLPDEVTQRLEHLVKLTGRSKTFYMVEAICEHIDDLEDLYLAEQRLIDYRAGKTQSVSLEEVMKRYGLES